jgi:hypothetical protein
VPSSTRSIEIVSVLSAIDFGDSPSNPVTQPTRYRTLGLDVDGRCTLDPGALTTGQECHLPDYAHGVPDGPQGQDNAVGALIQFIRDRVPSFTTENYTQALRAGKAANIIFHATGYNGELNDDRVNVSLLIAAPFGSYRPNGTEPILDGSYSPNGTQPKWDGNDLWPIASDCLKDGKLATPRFIDENAYVSNGKLVFTIPDATLRLIVSLDSRGSANLKLVLHGGVDVCDIVPTTVGRWGYNIANCIFSARWKADDLVHQLSQFPDPLTPAKPQPLCTNSLSYCTFKKVICGLIDVHSYGGLTTTQPCDSLSLGETLNLEPALIGNVFEVNDPVNRCLDEYEPSHDSCDNIPTGDAGVGCGAPGGL